MTDLKALAVVWAVKTFRSYDMGTRFKVVTDHNALKALVHKATLEGRLARWADFLMGFDFEIIYRRGKENIVADTLSCSMLSQELMELDTTAKYDMVVAKRLNLIIVPEERRKILLQVSHRSMTGHLKFDKLLQFLKLQYFWTSIEKDVKEFINKCNI